MPPKPSSDPPPPSPSPSPPPKHISAIPPEIVIMHILPLFSIEDLFRFSSICKLTMMVAQSEFKLRYNRLIFSAERRERDKTRKLLIIEGNYRKAYSKYLSVHHQHSKFCYHCLECHCQNDEIAAGRCLDCRKSFCSKCRIHNTCDLCKEFFCDSCREVLVCSRCNEGRCSFCDNGSYGLCSFCPFVSCGACQLVSKCSDGEEEACQDCQLRRRNQER